MQTDDDYGEQVRQYQTIARKYPIRWVEVEQVDRLTFDEQVAWPDDVESAYVVLRSRKVDGTMVDVVVHVCPRQIDAVTWALTDDGEPAS